MKSIGSSLVYDRLRRDLFLECPPDFNFAFDVLAEKAQGPEKNALICINRSGVHTENVSYRKLDQFSSRFANALLSLGVAKSDTVLVVLPRWPEWYYTLFGCAKMGAIAMPGTNLLTAKDMEYRINRAEAKVAVVSETHAKSIEKIKENCPTLKHLIIVRDERKGWHNFDRILYRVFH